MSTGQKSIPTSNNPLLHSKFMPPRLNSNVVPRDDLLSHLDRGISRKLAVVIAPTGFGKTTLSTLMTSQHPSFQTLLTPIINDLARLNETSVLVLEDFHFIASKEIVDGVSFLIQHLPNSLHLILITRTEPGLPLPLLRVRDEMMEITVADLRFEQKETEGWVAGLHLIILSLRDKDRANDVGNLIQSFSGRDRYVADYLIEEVFKNQSETVQSFFLKTCFFNRLTSSLCDAIIDVNNSSAMLEQLERDSLFLVQLERHQEQPWYRYSPIFAESIQHLARQRIGEAGIQTLFEKASNWYEYQGLLDEEVETAVTAKLFERAITLIERFIEIHDLREMNTLERWLAKIPQQTIMLHPTICFTHAQVILYSRDRFASATATRIEPFLGSAESVWRTEENHGRIGQLLSFCGNVQWSQGDFLKAFQYARQSLAELPEHDVFWRGNSLLIISYEALQAGRIRDAQDYVLEARALFGLSNQLV